MPSVQRRQVCGDVLEERPHVLRNLPGEAQRDADGEETAGRAVRSR